MTENPSARSPAVVSFEGAGVSFGDTQALSGIDAEVAEGELCVLVGPSGSGKSTLLRLVNRLIEPTEGVVRVRGQNVAGLDPVALRLSIGYAIQSVGLFPHRTVAENVATVPRLLGWPPARIRETVAAMLALVRLDPQVFASRRPAELSGGEAQRVGLARALAGNPDLLLMDEPFGAVDPLVRRELRAELARIHAQTGKTILLVTHDPGEALELATRLMVLRGGMLLAAGSPEDLLAPGGDAFVRALLGSDAALRRLGRTAARDLVTPGDDPAVPAIPASATLAQALARMVETRSSRLAVQDGDGQTLGLLDAARLVEAHP